MKIVYLYFSSLAIFILGDTLWLGLVAKNFYRNNLKSLLADDFNQVAAGSFYLIFISGVIIFAVLPALRDGNFAKALIFGGLFGFFAYATYDLTNLATLKNWPITLSAIDIVWGASLTAVVAATGYLIGHKLGL